MYTIISTKNIKLIQVYSQEYGYQDWQYGKIRIEHSHDTCAVCGLPVNIVGYHAVTRGTNRNDRICTRCVYAWIPEKKIG